MLTAATRSPHYADILAKVRRLSVEEQLALVADIATVLQAAVHTEDELREAAYLAESPAFRRIAERSLQEIEAGRVRPVEELLGEL